MPPDAPGNSILWIGRMLFGRGYRVREVELAQRISNTIRLFALDHTDALSKQRSGLSDKLKLRLELYRAPFEVLEEGPITRFRMAVATATGPLFSGAAAAERNERSLHDAMQRFGCGQVYLSSPYFFLPPERRDYRLHFDVIDNFHDHWRETGSGRKRREFHREQLRRADTISASSLQLCDYVQRLADRSAVYIPNGAPLAEMRAVDRAAADAIRERLKLGGKFVLGFIGNHTQSYYGMERIVRAVVKARARRPDLALLVVGPGGEKALQFCSGEDDGFVVTGSVPPDEVAAYFSTCDAGVHPYDLRPQTHDAMALNVIEFSAAGKPVLSNPLREFQRLALPNVRFTTSDGVDEWVSALVDPASFAPFSPEKLEQAIARFDWDMSAQKLIQAMNGEHDASS